MPTFIFLKLWVVPPNAVKGPQTELHIISGGYWPRAGTQSVGIFEANLISKTQAGQVRFVQTGILSPNT
jgi:hypothetical protein